MVGVQQTPGGELAVFPIGDGGVLLRLKVGDLTEERCDAIVNAANSGLWGGGGVDGAIHRAGGPMIAEECARIRAAWGGCPPGQAVITLGGKLPSKYVIHTVGPVWQGGGTGEDEVLASAYRSSLELAAQRRLCTVAFPSISTGAYGFPIERAARVALAAILDYLESDAGSAAFCSISLVLFSRRDYMVYLSALKALRPHFSAE